MPLNERFTALDVFRGMTICFMIIVNTPGDWNTTFSPLHHAQWHGFTPTDLVFPSFLFAVGNAMSFVMLSWAAKSNGYVVGKILKRTFLIFLLGYLMYWYPFFDVNEAGEWVMRPISNTRIMGVLQRIALCYGIAALMIHFLKIRTATIITGVFLVGYWLLLYFLGEDGQEFTMTGNVGYKIDLWVLGESHLYNGEGVPFDPEGLLGTLPAVGNVVIGFLVGKFLQEKGKTYEALTKLMVAGFTLLIAAYFWNLVFPINKKLWTSSFVLHTSGLDCLILATIIYVIDFLHKTRWTNFFEIVGRNPLFIYLLSEVLAITLYAIHVGETSAYQWIYQTIFSHAGPYIGSLLFALTVMLICWLAGYWLDKKRIYVRV